MATTPVYLEVADKRSFAVSLDWPGWARAGKTPDEVAAALSDPSSPVAQGVIGAANVITATICTLTDDQPSNVCGNSAVAAIEAKVRAQSKVS